MYTPAPITAATPLGVAAWTGGPDAGPTCPLCLRALKGATLADHLAGAGHSSHDPACGRCHKHFSTFEALTEHLYGVHLPSRAFLSLSRPSKRADARTRRPGAKASRNCGPEFKQGGCRSCLGFFASPEALETHRPGCLFAHTSVRCPPAHRSDIAVATDSWIQLTLPQPSAVPVRPAEGSVGRPLAVALDCEMVDVQCQDGRVRGAAARVCVVDEAERVLLHSLIKPAGRIVDYKFEFTGASRRARIFHALWSPVLTPVPGHTGLKPGDLDDAPDLESVRSQVAAILRGESDGHAQPPASLPVPAVPRVLVGHGLENDMKVLHMSHPAALLRDTAIYPPLQRATTKGRAHKLRSLVSLHLGYEIQTTGAAHDPEEDAVGAMRLYKRVKCLTAGHAAQAARDEQALRRAQGGSCWAAAARGVRPADAAAAVDGDAAQGKAGGGAELYCWCLDSPAALQVLSSNT